MPDADFYDDRWTVTLQKQPTTDIWDISVMNDYGEINEDGVTATVQPVGQTMITSTINVPFVFPGSIGTADGVDAAHENNRHLHVTVHDSHAGSSNYIFNEGMYVEDIYAYPQVETPHEMPLLYEKLCLNEDESKRYTCAFDKVRDWTRENAEKTMLEIHGSMINNDVGESKSYDYYSTKSNDIELQNRLAHESERANDLFSDRYVVSDDGEFSKYWEIYQQFLEKNS